MFDVFHLLPIIMRTTHTLTHTHTQIPPLLITTLRSIQMYRDGDFYLGTWDMTEKGIFWDLNKRVKEKRGKGKRGNTPPEVLRGG